MRQKVAAFKGFVILGRKGMFSQLHAYYGMCLHRKGHELTIFTFQGPCNSPERIIESFMKMETKTKMTLVYCILYIFLLFE